MAEILLMPEAKRALRHPVPDVLYVGRAHKQLAELYAAGRLTPSAAVAAVS